jgi:hypothetical protein
MRALLSRLLGSCVPTLNHELLMAKETTA